jgi:signal transduction histidine kinase/ActR/RegA family two-component response regulator
LRYRCEKMLLENDNHHYTHDDLSVLNLLKAPVWVFDLERRTMYWANRSALVVWNADTLESLLARDYESDMSDSSKTRVDEMLVKVIRNEVWNEDWTLYPNGIPTHTRITCSAIRVHDGRLALLVEGEVMDKTDVIESTVRYIEMLRHLPFSVGQYSLEGKLIYQNPEAARQFEGSTDNTDSKENVDSVCDEALQDDELLRLFVDQDLGKATLEKVRSGDDVSGEMEYHTQQGPKWFSVGLRRTRDPVSSNCVVLFSARDITEIIRARKETSRAELKSEFMAVMAHEIRTPLHQIVGYLDLLEMSKLTVEQLEHLKQVQSSTSLLMSIINDLLDYSKLECGQVQVESVNFALEGVIEGCVASVRPAAERKMLTLQSNLDKNVPMKLMGDPNRLRQILLNLLSNAVKFTDAGSVSVSVSSVERNGVCHRLRFEVIDTGIGIDPAEQEVVFDKYRQANASVARHFGGTGLGLAICKGLAELMGGFIGLESEVGKGTTMYFEIPFQLIDPVVREPKDRESTHGLTGDACSLRILVAEDNTINQKVMLSMLQRLGHTVTIAENGQVALDELNRAIFDLVLMDVQMPVMDGIECTKQIRNAANMNMARVPVIGLTASFQNADLEYYQELGMNACLGKPLRLEQLKQAVSCAALNEFGWKCGSSLE